MLILGIDFETTGLDVENDSIIEVGAVLWDTERKTPVYLLSHLVQIGTPVPKEITEITGIDSDMLADFGEEPLEVFNTLNALIKSCNKVVAHNGTLYDKPILKSNLKKYGVDWIEKPWIDTSTDVPFPEKMTVRKLTYLAAEHGFVNPFAHRAVFDVLTMLTVMNKYSLEEVCKLASEPTLVVQALVSYDDRELAKARGYRWEATKKQWIKSLKQSQLEKESTAAPFKVREVV